MLNDSRQPTQFVLPEKNIPAETGHASKAPSPSTEPVA
jgi:hypothetical protein